MRIWYSFNSLVLGDFDLYILCKCIINFSVDDYVQAIKDLSNILGESYVGTIAVNQKTRIQ